MTSHPATTTGGPVHQVLARLRPRDRMLIRLLGGHQVLSADRIYDDAPPRCVQPGRLVLILLDQPEHEQQLHHMPSFSSLRPVATTVPTRHGDGPAGAIWR